MRKYEILYIVHPELDEGSRKALVESINSIFTSKAKIVKIEDWGSRELAYEIKKQKRGHYMILTIETDNNSVVKEFERIVNINENVLRYIVVKLD